ncbi:mitochondrial processing peptidase [Scheffersomyces xylosifermentans]|uniref:mitochondrial processing peptidase n=1 Tax=Scheffersomyces xylosifermentans TaxID=1304137 RepID=UPI00315CB04F
MTSTITKSSFVKQTSFEVDFAPTHITKWRSARTGLQLTYINQPSPVVNGYFAVATEIENNTGSPHTLEHLVFMGSKKYPFKGLLDTLGSRLYSTTNAWTSVDQTVYTLTTAGWQGFKTLLPIYLDHLLYPTITEEACLTEVYHVDGEGKQKGVVFSEMQGIENQSWFITYQKMQETLFAAKSGYSSETGGLTTELPTLTRDDIKKFHESSYRPDNLCVIITGSVEEDELLSIMTEFDNELVPLPETPNKRPFVDSEWDPPLTKTIVKDVEFPDEDESMGELLISWIGPDANDTLKCVALDMIAYYFTDSPISLFNKNLVEIENPLATDIDYSPDSFVRTIINFTLSGVPTEKLEEVDTKLKDLVLSQTKPENFDLEYMKQIVQQQRLKYISRAEKSASTFSSVATLEFIYGNPDGSDLIKWTKDLSEYDVVLSWTAEQWSQLILEEFVNNKSATILGRPSSKLNDQFKKQNKKLSAEIKAKYGKEGLKKLGEQLEKAQQKNDIPIPEELLIKYEKPDPSKIAFIETASYKAGHTEGIVTTETNKYLEDKFSVELKKDTPEEFPLFFHFEDFKSQFTVVNIIMSSTTIDPKLLRYMSIVEELFSLSIQLPNGGKYIPYDQVISEVNNDLIEFQLDNGYENQFLELLGIRVKFESGKYKKAIEWILNVTKYAVFEESRVKIIIEKIINSIPDKKRNGELMMYSSQHRHMFQETSLRKSQDSMYTEDFYKNLLEEIENGQFAKIQKDLNTFTKQLFQLDNMKVFVLGNVQNLKGPVSSWSKFVDAYKAADRENGYSPVSFEKLPRSFEFKSELGKKCSEAAYLVLSPAADSSHLITSSPIPNNYLDEDIFKIALASEILNVVEGPFWKGIRGAGLAYHVSAKRDIETGLLTYTIYRASDIKKAWQTSKSIVEEYGNGKVEIDDLSIENAIASIVNELANGESNSYYAATSKISDNLFKRRGPDYIKFFLKKLNSLKAEDIVYAIKKYFIPLFDSKSAVVFSSLPSEQGDELEQFFGGLGFKVERELIAAEPLSDDEEGSEEDSEGSDEDSEEDSDEDTEEGSDDE